MMGRSRDSLDSLIRPSPAPGRLMSEVTRLLAAVETGDAKASAELLPLVYDELRSLAAHRIANDAAGQTLQATALVHEAYMRLVGNEEVCWESRAHFFGAAAEAMRRVLIDRARAKGRQKRGGGRKRVDLDPANLMLDEVPQELVDLDAALNKLAEEDPTKARLVSLRFFGGLSRKEAAAILGIPLRTADRYWSYARLFLFSELNRDDEDARPD